MGSGGEEFGFEGVRISLVYCFRTGAYISLLVDPYIVTTSYSSLTRFPLIPQLRSHTHRVALAPFHCIVFAARTEP